MATLTQKPLDWFKIDPKQPRKHFIEAELRELGESMKALGQLQPVLARADGTLLAGERRKRAAPLAGLTELLTIITDRMLSDSEIRQIQLAENIHRAALNGYEQWMGCSELMCMNPGWQLKELAHAMKKDQSWATRVLSPSRCSPQWQEALKDGKVGISDCYAASKLPEREQAELLALKLGGASRDAIEQAGRKKRRNDKQAITLSRVKIAMPGGVSVVVTGKDLGMTEIVELLTETLKEARKAVEQFDVKTWQAMMRDKSRVG